MGITQSENESECVDFTSSASASISEQESDLGREPVELGDTGTAQESLGNRICELYAEETGEEVTENDLRDIFTEVKRMFAEEAEKDYDSEEDYAVDSEDDIDSLAR